MGLSAVKGQSRAIEALRKTLGSRALHHAYLFTGPEGVGKELTATALAQALLCGDRPGEGCGECATCVRVVRGNHPDVFWVLTEAERAERGFSTRADSAGAPSREIRVEQVRELQERLSLRALEGASKVAIVAGAHKLNPQAQNALLKTLEEPPSETHLILVTSAPDRLLPTLRSRCIEMRFAPLARELIREKLKELRQVDSATADLLAAMAFGSLRRALTLDPESLSVRRELFDAFESLSAQDVRPALRLAEKFGSNREEAENALALLSLWLRDLLAARNGGAERVNLDLSDQVSRNSARYSSEALHRRCELLDQTQEHLERNGSPRLQLERMLILMSREAGAQS